MANMKADILAHASGEAIEAIVISECRIGWRSEVADNPIAGKVSTWEQAAPFLDYHYDNGYGAQDCHSIYAWTATRVLLVSEYDGSTSITSVPRHPINGEPEPI